MSDIVGNAHMIQSSTTTFTSDRHGNPNSALNLNGGYTELPQEIYFNTLSFSVTVWIYFSSNSDWLNLFFFGNGCENDEISLAQQDGGSGLPFFRLYDENQKICEVKSNEKLISSWKFLTVNFDRTD